MHRIYVQSTVPDARAKVKQKAFQSLGLKNKIGAVCLTEAYTINTQFNHKQFQLAKQLLANPLTESADTALKAPRHFNFAIEIGFLPGVTDNIGNTAKETLADGAKIKFKDGQSVYSSQIFFVSFANGLNDKKYGPDAERIASSLYNPLIQRAAIKSRAEFLRDGGMDIIAPKVKLSASTKISKVDLNISDEDLAALGKLGIIDSDGGRRGPLSMSLDYLRVIRDHFNKLGRNPTDVEIETLGQTWSEHCKHTIFADPMDELQNGIYKTYIKGATEKIRKQKGSQHKDKGHLCAAQGCPLSGHDFCVSVFTDNAGGILFDQDWIITHKVETHNTPSALDPFGGSITGIVGVNRDCLGFGLGAKPIINTYGFCFGNPDDERILYRDKNLQSPMLSPKRIMQGVISGINAGGNQSGIPTNSGFMYFDDRYRGKPLVFAGTVGLIPKTINGKPSWIKRARPGDLIVMAGGRVGADGIHGATFASETLDSHSPATAVQIGDPITQKKLSDTLVKEARDLGLYSSLTDCGAGGLSSAVGEMAQATNGCLVNLDEIPLKYPGLAPWQIWISESQERMVLAVPPKKWKNLQRLLKNRGVEATAIGKFTDDGNCTVKFKNQTALNLDLEFLHNGRPRKHQVTQPPDGVIPRSAQGEESLKFDNRQALRNPSSFAKATADKSDALGMTPIPNLNSQILHLLSRPNLASNEFVSMQYDHEVQAGSVLKPLQGRGRVNAEATVTRPVLDSQKGVILSCGLNPSYSELNPFNMAACAIDSAVRAAVAAGADIDYLALLDNFCWCSPEDPHRLWQLKEAARACYKIATAFGTPFISGKDSMYNDFKGYDDKGHLCHISIPPTLLISAIGVVPDALKTVSLDAKMPGDLLYMLGETDDEMGGSEYLSSIENSKLKIENFSVPSVNAAKNYQLYKTLFQAVQQNLIASSISVSRGGFIVALIKKLMGGGLGANINLANLPGNWNQNYQALFSESQGRILVTVAPQNNEKFERLMKDQAAANIGKISKNNQLAIKDKNNKPIVNLKIDQALAAYRSAFKNY